MPFAVTLRLDDATAAPLVAMWRALAGFGVFPGSPAAVWAAPVVTETLLARQAALVAAQAAPCHGHHRPGHWVPHVTLGHAEAPGRAVELLAPLWRGPLCGRLDRLELVRFRPVSVLRSLSLRRGCRRGNA